VAYVSDREAAAVGRERNSHGPALNPPRDNYPSLKIAATVLDRGPLPLHLDRACRCD